MHSLCLELPGWGTVGKRKMRYVEEGREPRTAGVPETGLLAGFKTLGLSPERGMQQKPMAVSRDKQPC